MLRTSRLGAGLTTTQLARNVGVTPAAVTNIETGRDKPSVQLAERLEQELGTVLFERGACPCGCGCVTIGGSYAHNHEARVRDRERIAGRQAQLKGLLAEGCTQLQASELLGVSTVTISKDVAAMRDELDELGIVTRRAATPPPARPVDTLSCAAAARVLGRAAKAIRRLCESGELPATRFGREWAIDAAAVVHLALELDLELWSLREASRRTGVPRYAIENLERAGRLNVLPGGPRRARMLVPAQLQALLDELERNPDLCPAGDGPVEPGRTWHKKCHWSAIHDAAIAASVERWSDPEYRADRSEQMTTEMRRQWRGPRAWRQAQPRERRPCHVCRAEVERRRYKFARADAQKRRVVCSICVREWSSGLVRARCAAVRAASPLKALTEAYAIGQETQARLRELRPLRFGGRPRDVAIELAIEALHVSRGLSDGTIRALIGRELGTVNARYVTRHRETALIRRR